MKATVVKNDLHKLLMQMICIISHQAKLIEIRKQPPWVDISQAVGHLQVCERSRKHLRGTKKAERE